MKKGQARVVVVIDERVKRQFASKAKLVGKTNAKVAEELFKLWVDGELVRAERN